MQAILRTNPSALFALRLPRTSVSIRAIHSPKEHGGLKRDGTPDKRVKEDHSSSSESGSSSGGEKYSPKEHDGLKKDGTPDKRVSSDHGLGADRERASELGKKGGRASGGEEN
ncbi:hypothetical protein BDY24DRAFT_392580 [Mrakia frigida]|uniref:uncharacterized protein n=1 Tax=Mrakia frigida TaxID=29902 RepID=UPI003FCC197F